MGEGIEGCEPRGRGGFIHFISAGVPRSSLEGRDRLSPRALSPACPSWLAPVAALPEGLGWALTVVAADSEMVR